jgi:hypothetical protein
MRFGIWWIDPDRDFRPTKIGGLWASGRRVGIDPASRKGLKSFLRSLLRRPRLPLETLQLVDGLSKPIKRARWVSRGDLDYVHALCQVAEREGGFIVTMAS